MIKPLRQQPAPESRPNDQNASIDCGTVKMTPVEIHHPRRSRDYPGQQMNSTAIALVTRQVSGLMVAFILW
jgi:hypothetical protein